jgi:hypothetical protein
VRRAAVIVLAVMAAGCGRGNDRAEIRGVVSGFLSAYEADLGPAACNALSEGARAELVSEEAKPCPQAVASLDLEPGRVERVVVDLDGALVDLSSGETAFVTRTANGWRLSAVGCSAEDGPPTRFPMDCELSA